MKTNPIMTRRKLGLAALGATFVPFVARITNANAADVCVPFNADMQKAITPDEAVAELKAGNDRYSTGKSVKCDYLAEAKATEAKQTPFACVLGCIDSRVPPELVFDQQIGDVFVARVAGNVATTEIIGSFEYATKVAGAKAIVVLGHSSCGAVKGTIDKAQVGSNLTALLNEIEPAFASLNFTGERTSKDHELVHKVAEANIHRSVKALTEKSPVLKELVDTGALKIVGAMHDLATNKVTFLA